ncbi:MAG: M20/M25/M40 family metallo-hydrolase [Bacteroidales bacterium]|nr:M20/M25/M40 family metallo-hydrolase [Bacteroidales bacterium]
MSEIGKYCEAACKLLSEIVAIPSESFHETKRADFLCSFLQSEGFEPARYGNNIVVRQAANESGKPVLMLNAHIDTVAAASGYTFDPVNPPADRDRILGLGSNDDGASVVCMIFTFIHAVRERLKLPVNLMLALSCEEERSGENGMRMLRRIVEREADFAIVGEPTEMKAAIAEKGLLVVDASCEGRSAHCAHAELGVNAIYKAVTAISSIRDLEFSRVSPSMGRIGLNITQINAGTAHNVIPDSCNFVVDIRTTDSYTNEEVMELLNEAAPQCDLKARNMRNHASATPQEHPLLKTAEKLGVETYVSPTTSDWMRLSIPAIKMGPGDSNRSHKADEFVYRDEIADGLKKYLEFISNIQV